MGMCTLSLPALQLDGCSLIPHFSRVLEGRAAAVASACVIQTLAHFADSACKDQGVAIAALAALQSFTYHSGDIDVLVAQAAEVPESHFMKALFRVLNRFGRENSRIPCLVIQVLAVLNDSKGCALKPVIAFLHESLPGQEPAVSNLAALLNMLWGCIESNDSSSIPIAESSISFLASVCGLAECCVPAPKPSPDAPAQPADACAGCRVWYVSNILLLPPDVYDDRIRLDACTLLRAFAGHMINMSPLRAAVPALLSAAARASTSCIACRVLEVICKDPTLAEDVWKSPDATSGVLVPLLADPGVAPEALDSVLSILESFAELPRNNTGHGVIEPLLAALPAVIVVAGNHIGTPRVIKHISCIVGSLAQIVRGHAVYGTAVGPLCAAIRMHNGNPDDAQGAALEALAHVCRGDPSHKPACAAFAPDIVRVLDWHHSQGQMNDLGLHISACRMLQSLCPSERAMLVAAGARAHISVSRVLASLSEYEIHASPTVVSCLVALLEGGSEAELSESSAMCAARLPLLVKPHLGNQPACFQLLHLVRLFAWSKKGKKALLAVERGLFTRPIDVWVQALRANIGAVHDDLAQLAEVVLAQLQKSD